MTIQDKIAALGPMPIWGNYRVAIPDNYMATAVYQADRANRAEAERDLALEVLRDITELAEFWFERETRKGMSETAYKTWYAISYGSGSYRNARAVLAACEGGEPE